MKNLIILVISFTTLTSCDNKDSTDNAEDTIIGKWQLIETYGDPGDGSGVWITVSENDTYIFHFNDNNTFERAGSVNDCSGNYSTENIVLILNCDGGTNTEPTYSFSFNKQYLILDGSPYNCDESCSEKFERVMEQ